MNVLRRLYFCFYRIPDFAEVDSEIFAYGMDLGYRESLVFWGLVGCMLFFLQFSRFGVGVAGGFFVVSCGSFRWKVSILLWVVNMSSLAYMAVVHLGDTLTFWWRVLSA